MTRILDLSHHNNITDFNKIIDPVIIKCTESTSYLDPTFKERREILRKKRLYLGCYHFFRDVDPIKQADFFLSHEHKDGELLILDFEINCSNPVEKCQKFLKRIESKWIYTNDYRANKYAWPKDWKFWIARYGVNNGKESYKPKFKDWDIWQYTSRGRINGIVGNVDLNYAESLPEISKPLEPLLPPTKPSGFTKYSQNDPRWKDDKIGGSRWTIGAKGCLLSIICTLASWFGETITPKELALHKELFTISSNPRLDGLLIWYKLDSILKTVKFLSRIRQFDERMIDNALIINPNTCVFLNVDYNYHWVGALKKTNTGYTSSDPYPYPAVNRNYKNSTIGGFAILIKK